MPDSTGAATPPAPPREEAFFILRDCRELFQRGLAGIARQAGLNAPAVIDAFVREIATAHDELAASSRADGFGQTDGLTASRISLVGNDDLELEIRIGDIITRLKGNERIDRWRVQLRYMTLLDRPKMTAEDNPAGLEPLSRGLWAICMTTKVGLEQNLEILDRLEAQLQADLPDLYRELNTLLEQRGVALPPTRPIQRSSGGVVTPTATAQTGALPANALSALQNKLLERSGEGGVSAGAADAGPVLGNAALSASTLTMLNHLMERLNTLEQRQIASPMGTQPDDPAPAQQSLHAINARDLDLPLGKSAAVALDTLSLIFDAIFATPDLPDVVKSILSRLQIPLLRTAILDDTFFANTQHPARQLINRMARAACGLTPDAGRDHPLCERLSQLADSARSAMESNESGLQPQLEELDRLIAERDQTHQLNSQPYMHLVSHHERRLNAGVLAKKWLNEQLAQCSAPAIRDFLAAHGVRIMQDAAENGGVDGERWKASNTTFAELLWSIQPKQAPEERKRLVALVPALLKRLNSDLDQLGISTEARTPFLNACFDLQTAALRNRPDPAAALPPSQINPAAVEISPIEPDASGNSRKVEILESNGKLVQYFGSSAPAGPAWRAGSSAARQGDWIALRLPDDEEHCGLHCGVAPDSGCVLLFNSDWGYAVALERRFLEQQLAGGSARIVSAAALFDEAAERALGQIARRAP